MKILLDGYFDRNLGDDLMLTLTAKGFRGHELYVPSKKIKLDNAVYTDKKTGFDAYIRTAGEGFKLYNNLGILYRLREMHAEHRYAPLTAAVNCSLSGDFINRAGEAVIKKQLSMYDYMTVRDRFSYTYIRKKLPRLDVKVYPDMVFSLPDEMIPDEMCDGALGISAHSSMDCEKIAAVADGYICETGRRVLLLCFDSGAEDDEAAARKAVRASQYKDMIDIVLYENIPDMLRHIKRCAVILGIRFHASVLAARMGIPFVPVIYSMKTLHALSDLGYKRAVYMNDFNVSDVLGRMLTETPFEISRETISLAGRHIADLKENWSFRGCRV